MKRCLSAPFKPATAFLFISIVLCTLVFGQWFSDRSSTWRRSFSYFAIPQQDNTTQPRTLFYQRPRCACTRPFLEQKSAPPATNETSSPLCSEYATLRGSHQRVLAISMFGPKENNLFVANRSLDFLHALVADMKRTYPGWILRVYHDATINEDVICPVECAHGYVDFCNTSAMGSLGRVNEYLPPKIWRFLPAGDVQVDVMGSRDLDSPLEQRELDAVNEWLASGKAWHAMRDHPYHSVPMLGGMWGFRPELDRSFSSALLRKILDRSLISRYGGRLDQSFLSDHVWPHIQNSVISHDSFLCTTSYGKSSRPWPTRRQPFNGTICFVGCVRPCCEPSKNPFGECPVACRPKEHPNWTFC